MAIAFGPRHMSGASKPVWSSFDPKLVVGDHPIPVMGPDGCKYLGPRFDPSLSECAVKSFIVESLSSWLDLVDTTQILGIMKC